MFKQIVNLPADARIFVVGDIHGEISKLNKELAKIGFSEKADMLISVGDLIDRGEDSVAGLELITKEWFKAVRGNHEDMMINGLCNGDKNMLSNWVFNGGSWFFRLDQVRQEYAKSLAEMAKHIMPYIIEVRRNDEKYVVCHADYPSDHYPAENEEALAFDIIWSRSRIKKVMNDLPHKAIKGADLFIFGHTPLREVIRADNCVWIDTGACYSSSNPLTVLQL